MKVVSHWQGLFHTYNIMKYSGVQRGGGSMQTLAWHFVKYFMPKKHTFHLPQGGKLYT